MGCPRIGEAITDVHVTPAYGPWKHGLGRYSVCDTPTIKDGGSVPWN